MAAWFGDVGAVARTGGFPDGGGVVAFPERGDAGTARLEQPRVGANCARRVAKAGVVRAGLVARAGFVLAPGLGGQQGGVVVSIPTREAVGRGCRSWVVLLVALVGKTCAAVANAIVVAEVCV